jgi:hypothetical protein
MSKEQIPVSQQSGVRSKEQRTLASYRSRVGIASMHCDNVGAGYRHSTTLAPGIWEVLMRGGMWHAW